MADPVPDGFFILRNLKHPSDVLHRPDGILLTWYTEDDAEEFLAARIDDGKEWAVSKLTAHDYRRFNATRCSTSDWSWSGLTRRSHRLAPCGGTSREPANIRIRTIHR